MNRQKRYTLLKEERSKSLILGFYTPLLTLVLGLFFVAPVFATGDCPNVPDHIDGYHLLGEFGDSKYFISNNKLEYDEAAAAAAAIGGHLVVMTTQAEEDFVDAETTENAWIGYSDADQEGTFVWITGEPTGHTNWNAGEPDNSSPSGGQGDYAIVSPNGRWKDRNGHDRYKYVVEIPCSGFCTGEITGLIFDNLGSGADVAITNGATYSLSDLPAAFRIQALVSGDHESLEFVISGDLNQTQTENNTPYTIPGGSNTALTLDNGTYTVHATLYSENHLEGETCDELSLSFTIGDTPNCPTSFFNGGLIEVNEAECTIESINPPDFNGEPLEIVWIKSPNSTDCNVAIGELGPINVGAAYDAFLAAGGFGVADPGIGATSWMFADDGDGDDLSFNASDVFEPTCFFRCARPVGCERFFGEAGPVTISCTPPPPLDCEDEVLAYWSLDDCFSQSGNGSAQDYSELTPDLVNTSNCLDVQATNLFRVSGGHSCTPGFNNEAVCVASQDVCDASNLDDDRAYRLEVSISPETAGEITELSFYNSAPETYDWGGNAQGPSNYPTLYSIKVLKNGAQIFEQNDIPTTRGFTLQTFDFSSNPAFRTNAEATFVFLISGYCRIGNGASASVFEIDEIRVNGGCCEETPDCPTSFFNGGLIEVNEAECTIESINPPDFNGEPLEIVWIKSPNSTDCNVAIGELGPINVGAAYDAFLAAGGFGVADPGIGATSWMFADDGDGDDLSFNASDIFEPTCFFRCARPVGCERFFGEAGPVTISCTPPPPLDCEDEVLAYWSLDDCFSQSGNGSAQDYSELTPDLVNTSNCLDVQATNLFRVSGGHSCTPGFNNEAVCVASQDVCDASNLDDDRAYRLEVSISPETAGEITELSFYNSAPETYDWGGNAQGPSNYPTLYSIKVLKNGAQIFEQNDIPTTRGFTLQTFDFSSNPAFRTNAEATFVFLISGYCRIGNGASASVFEIDEIRVNGGCCEETPTCPDPNAGSLTLDVLPLCIDGCITATATPNGDKFIPDGYSEIYVLTSGAGLVIEQVNSAPEFTVCAEGLYTIHTLVYDPATLDLNIVVPGQTTGFDVNSLLIQGGGDICASLDVTGAPFNAPNEDDCVNCEDYFDGGMTTAGVCEDGTITISSDAAPDAGGAPFEIVWIKSTLGSCDAALLELGPVNVGMIYNDFVAAGGFGTADANIPGTSWMFVADGDADDLSLTVSGLTEPACFMRCARIVGCDRFLGEGNLVPVDCTNGPSTEPVTYEACDNNLSVSGASNGAWYFLKVYTADYSSTVFECNSFTGGCAEPALINLPDGDYVLDVILLDDAWMMDYRLTAPISLPQTCVAPLVDNGSTGNAVNESRQPVATPDPNTNSTVRDLTESSVLEDAALSVFPNPAIGEIFFYSAQLSEKAVQMQIINSVGQVMHTQEFDALGDAPVRMDISNYAPGIYHVRFIEEGQKDLVKKFIITQGK